MFCCKILAQGGWTSPHPILRENFGLETSLVIMQSMCNFPVALEIPNAYDSLGFSYAEPEPEVIIIIFFEKITIGLITNKAQRTKKPEMKQANIVGMKEENICKQVGWQLEHRVPPRPQCAI